ncbi:MFS transporter [Streptomyces sp. NPDC056909]|uniref:MFS transporter n=1 Tax=Streptomyces sp. NPDC056909 TaxID=3345963 RepID=UPI0036743E64
MDRKDRWWRLGVPELAGQGRVVTATALDSFGAGMFAPLSFLFFVLTTDLTVAEVGWGTGIATVISLPLAPLAGTLVDRWGAKPCLIANNLLAAAGYLCYLAVDSLAGLVAAMFVVLCAERLYWASWPAFVADIAEGSELDKWYAFTAAGKNASVGLGGAIGGLVLGSGWSGAAVTIVVLNAGTSVVTALLFAFPSRRARTSRSAPAAAGEEAGAGERAGAGAAREGAGAGEEARAGSSSGPGDGTAAGWRAILRDRALLTLLVAQLALTFAWLIPGVILPVYLVEVSDFPVWLPSAALTLNSVVIVLGQSALTGRFIEVERHQMVFRAALLMLVSVGLLALLPVLGATVAVPFLALAVLFFAAGEMAAGPATTALAATAAPASARGRYLSLFNLTWAVSAVVGPVLVGALIERHSIVLWGVLALLITAGGLGFRQVGRAGASRSSTPAERLGDVEQLEA